MMKIKSMAVLLMGSLLMGNVAQADFADGLVGGLVGGAVGSVITNEIYNSNKPAPAAAPAPDKQHRSTKKHKKYVAPKNTSEMKIQRALSSLGFYRGPIDGEVNSYETRSAIKEMNRAYEISNDASLKLESKDTLIFLGTLFEFDRYLIARGTDKKTKGKKIQTALKIQGFYFAKIDGAVGPGTRNSISQYKTAKGLSAGNALDFEEEYQLVNSSKQINDQNIDETIATLKGLSPKKTNTVPILKMKPVENSTSPYS